MKKLFLLVAILFSITTFAQIDYGYQYIGQKYEWMGGMFKALNIPAGPGPADFTGPWQHRRAGALYYDSVGVDSGLYVWSGLAWRRDGGSGSALIAGEGIAITGDSIHLGGLIGAPAIFRSSRNIRIDTFNLQFTHKMDGETDGALWKFTKRTYSPFQFLTLDTINQNYGVVVKNMPLSAIYARRTLFFNTGGFRAIEVYGHYLGMTYNIPDSAVSQTAGGDYNQPVTLETRIEPRNNGTSIFQIGHTNTNSGHREQGLAAVVANMYVNGKDDSSSDSIRVKGTLVGMAPYLVANLGVGKTQIDNVVYLQPNNFVGGATRILKSYVLAPAIKYGTNFIYGDSAYLIFDTSTHARTYIAGKTVIGKGNAWATSDALKLFGNLNMTDSLSLGTIREANDSTNLDVVLSPRTPGTHALRRLRFDQLAALLGTGGTPTLQQVITAGNSFTNAGSSDGMQLFNSGTGMGFYIEHTATGGAYGQYIANQSGATGGLLINNGDATAPAQKINNNSTGIGLHIVSVSGGNMMRLVDGNQANGKVLTSDVNGNASWQNSAGGAPALTQYRLAIGDASNLLSTNAAITGNRALISDANGVPTHAATTATEIGYVNGVTSAIQTQLDNKEPLFSTNNGYKFFNEFEHSVGTTSNGGTIVATANGTGSGATISNSGAANRPGVIRATTGTTTTGRAAVGASASFCQFGGGTWSFEEDIDFSALSDGTNTYQALFGFFDDFTAANQTDGIYFLYDSQGITTGSAASANWQCVTISNGSPTFHTSSTAVLSGTWVRLGIEVNAAGTSVDFKVNGSTIHTATGTIPTGSSRLTGFGFAMFKSAGATSRYSINDYLKVSSVFTTPR